ncbi:MAG TPA: amino acid adenylation domain-containing protein [Pyrinomonadaceae bacterium]|nr:amino acid adenylation domain-containing protein [Pyrinomonadaceae bacterium]
MSTLATRIADLSSAKLELLAQRLREKRERAELQQSIPRRPQSDAPLPLSFAQQRLWFLDQLVPNSPAYNVPTSVRLSGPLNPDVLQQTFTELLRRHEILRTTFPMRDEQPHQLIAPPAPFHLPLMDLSQLPPDQREVDLQLLADQEAQRPFDLERGPLLRAALVRLAGEDHALLFTTHHIVSDAWSISILIKELSTLYAAFAAGGQSPLPELPLQYADYALWQRERLSGEVLEAELDYWRNQLGDTVAVLDLPTDHPRPNVQTQNGARYGLGLSRRLSDGIKELTERSGTTLFMTMLAAFQALLSRYTGQEQIAIGTPIAGRNRAETEPLIGFFINTLVLRTDLSGDPSFMELLERVRLVALGAYAHQELPFEKLVEELQPERDTGRSPLFQAMMVLQNTPPPTAAGAVEGLQLRMIETGRHTTQFDLVLNISWAIGELQLGLEYNTDLFEQATIQRMLRHMNVLLESVVSNPELRLSEVQLVTPEEQHQILVQWNDTASAYPHEKSIHQVFEEQVELRPEAVAVQFKDKQVTYKELNERANALAHHLQSQGVGPDTLVGISVERSIEMVVGLLGILKAGGAYVPIDTSYPLERQAKMLETVSVLVTQEDELEKMPAFWGPVVCFEDELGEAETNPVSNVSAENLAYVMYTSGSTGQPKGVEVPHRAVLRLVCGVQYVDLNSESCLLHLAPLSFDASTFELWGALLHGGRCVLSSERVPTPQNLGEMIERYAVDTMWLTASLYNSVIDEAPEALAGLKQLLIGGEALSEWHVSEGLRCLVDTAIINGYGPTEGTTFTCCYRIKNGEEWNYGIPIGGAINNTQIYVLDRKQQVVPVGVVGELYIGGAGLARGYLREAELTAERFVPNPYGRESGERLYRTGDMVRFLPDGRLEFMGRVDHQVKVRGHRIEMGEIETVLERHGSVREAAVLAREDVPGEKRLVAYVVKQPESVVTVTQLLEYVSNKLPLYMAPSAFVMLDEMPLTPNGKIDRRALPAPEQARPELEQGYVSPRMPTEEIVAGVWAQVLRVEQVGIDDDFFELGGHSLLATQVISRVRELFNVEIELRVMFAQPTVRALAEVIEEKLRVDDGLAAPAVVPVGRDVAIPLSFAQQRLWFLDQLEPGSSFYHIPAAVRLRGELDFMALERSFREVIRRHESLRTRFGVVDGVPVQLIDQAPEFRLTVLEVSSEAEAQRVAGEESQRPFDLSSGPMLRASVLRLSEQEHVLLCTMHHIISDGWSMGVLIRELTTLYAAFVQGEPSPLQELSIQYADYAHWQREWLQGEVLEKQLSYWKQQMEGAPAVLELPTDYPRPAVQTFNGAHQSMTLPAELTAGLKALTQREGVTLFMTLLAAFQTLLWRYSGQEDIVVSTGIANRNRAETEPLIGFFVNTLVLRTDLSGEPAFTELLRRVREVTLGAYAHQDVPFELLVEALAPERDARYTPLFQVMLVLQNARVGEAVKLAGLEVSGAGGESDTAKFDLTMFVEERGEELWVVLEYNTDLFAQSTIEQMLESFRRLVEGIVAAPEQSITTIEMIDTEERRRLTGRGGESLSADAEFVSVAHMFEAAVARNPEAAAIECGERRVAYGELDQRANTLANYLLDHRAGPGTIVALLMEQMSETIVGILGSLKAGAAFMPLDVRQPAARLRKLMELAPPEFLLTETKVVAALDHQLVNTKVLCVDGPEFLNYYNPEAPRVNSDPDQLSYIYFTSGSSGTPKAIAGRLKGIAHFINWEIEELGVGAGVRVSQLLSPSFDGSLRDIFLPLCAGGVVCVPERREQILEGRGLVQWLEQARIEVVHCVPSVFRALVNEDLRAEELSSLRYVVMAGEALVGRDVAKWKAVYGQRVGLVNLYGTSETTMAKFSYRVSQGDEEREVMPIGKPIAGAEAYLLDERGEPCGRGMVGEIYIRTPYRSLGYYNQPELTAAVFVPNPFSTDPNDLVHKTGDMGRVLEDGNFEYLGRRDEQVKVRGARVELKEVENAVRGQAGVLDVAVIEREDGSGYTYLCAYLVLAEGVQTVDVAEGVAQELPDYMVPSAYVELEELPRTISGKVDRRALPAVGAEGSGVEYVAPRTAVEELLVESWKQLLARERIGIEDNFFRLGGHSLLATQVMSRVRETFGVEVGLRVLFERPTVRGLGEAIEEQLRGEAQAAPAIAKVSREGELRLSYAQQRLWFLDQLEPGSSFYNIPAAVRLRGTLDLAALEQSFREVIRRHESLRTRFGVVNRTPVQLIDEGQDFSFAVLDVSSEAEARRVASEESQRPFDLSTGPLLRASLLRLSEQEHVLLCTMHHIISDGWSMGVLIRELTTLYEAYATGQESPLPELSIQYADYAHWQREWLQGEVLETQLNYWKQQMDGAPAVLELPTDYPRPPVQTFNGAHQSLTLPAELTAGLKALTQREGVTLFMTLLAAFQTLLWRYSGQEDIVVSTGIANRNRAETEPLIGFFVNTLVLRTDLSGEPSFTELLRRVREVTLGAYAHQDVPFELLVEALAPERDARYTPLFQVMFVLQNAPMSEESKLEGLQVSRLGGESGTAKFDLTLFVEERGEELGLVLEYNTDLFASATIVEMLESFRRLVEGIVAAPEQSIGSIEMIDANERLELIESWT